MFVCSSSACVRVLMFEAASCGDEGNVINVDDADDDTVIMSVSSTHTPLGAETEKSAKPSCLRLDAGEIVISDDATIIISRSWASLGHRNELSTAHDLDSLDPRDDDGDCDIIAALGVSMSQSSTDDEIDDESDDLDISIDDFGVVTSKSAPEVFPSARTGASRPISIPAKISANSNPAPMCGSSDAANSGLFNLCAGVASLETPLMLRPSKVGWDV